MAKEKNPELTKRNAAAQCLKHLRTAIDALHVEMAERGGNDRRLILGESLCMQAMREVESYMVNRGRR